MDNSVGFIIMLIVFLIVIFTLLALMQPRYNRRQIGGCAGTRYGCCPDNVTSKINPFGSNCPHPYNPYPPTPPQPHPHPIPKPNIGGCSGTQYGCCPDGKTARANRIGTNCPGYRKVCPNNTTLCKTNTDCSNCPSQNNGFKQDCSKTEFGCCPDGKTPKEDAEGTNCATSSETDSKENFVGYDGYDKQDKLGGSPLQ